MAKTYTVFTYGSLMRGLYGNKTVMADAEFLGTAEVPGELRFFSSDYPVMIKRYRGKGTVKGELFQVGEETMQKLRKYEGIGNPFTCYTESVVKAQTADGMVPARAFVVIPNLVMPTRLTSRKIPSGSWHEFRQGRKRYPIPSIMLYFFFLCLLVGIVYEWDMLMH